MKILLGVIIVNAILDTNITKRRGLVMIWTSVCLLVLFAAVVPIAPISFALILLAVTIVTASLD